MRLGAERIVLEFFLRRVFGILKVFFLIIFIDFIFIVFSFKDSFFKLKQASSEFFKSRGLNISHRSLNRFKLSKSYHKIEKNYEAHISMYINDFLMKSYKNSYKLILKNIVKNSYGLPVYKLIYLINKEIKYCNQRILFTSVAELDLFLYKLLWKFIKRSHPRRPNSWIYNKYWKNCSNVWRFFSYDPMKRSLIFLKSHRSLYEISYFLPALFTQFHFFNFCKYFTFYFRNYKFYLKGLYRVIFLKQRATCYKCRHILKPTSFLKLVNFEDNKKMTYPILLHYYCFI